MNLNHFANYLLVPIILVVGLLGNLMGIIVVSRKKLNKIGPILILIFLFIFDSLDLSIYIFFIFKILLND